jgi:hypothetical protein
MADSYISLRIFATQTPFIVTQNRRVSTNKLRHQERGYRSRAFLQNKAIQFNRTSKEGVFRTFKQYRSHRMHSIVIPLQKAAHESLADPSPFNVGYLMTARRGLNYKLLPAFVRRYEHLLNDCRRNTHVEEYFETFFM